MNRKELVKELQALLGEKKVKTSPLWCLSYAYDATPTGYGTAPVAVVFPESAEDVSKVVALAQAYGTPIYPRGAGSGLTGGAVPVQEGVVLSMEKMDKVLEIDEENLTVLTEPGVVTYDLQKAVEEKGLFYPPDPSSYRFSTIGGNIAENAGGPRCVKYGVTKDYVLQLEVVFADGSICRLGSKAVKSVAGYNLKDLIVGSEGTLAVITKALLKLIPAPEAVRTAMAVFDSVKTAVETVTELFLVKVVPTCCELLDRNSITAVERYTKAGFPADAGALLILEVDGYSAVVDELMSTVVKVCRRKGAQVVKTATTAQEAESIWLARRAVSPAIARLKPVKVNEDVCVPRSRIPALIEETYKIADRHNLLVVNFGHAGDGNIHVNFMCEESQMEEAETAVEELFARVVELEGSISGEHGIGLTKRKFLPMEVGRAICKMKAVKKALDPKNILNPGKIFEL